MFYHPRPPQTHNPKKNLGLIHVYTGPGKGKTTAALGLAMRSLGQGHRVAMVQFLKGHKDAGELLFYQQLKEVLDPQFELIQFGQDKALDLTNPSDFDIYLARRGMDYVRQLMINRRPDLLILDEINPALHYGFLSLDDVLDFLENKHQQTEVVLTGEQAPAEIIDLAHLVTQMDLIKHYYHRRYPARYGIEI